MPMLSGTVTRAADYAGWRRLEETSLAWQAATKCTAADAGVADSDDDD